MADEKATREYIGITPEIFADFTGERVTRDLRIKDTQFKLSFNLPVPPTADEVAEMYGVSSGKEVLAIAVKQISYGRDSGLRKHLNENGPDIDWENADGTAEAAMFEADLKTAPERKVSERTAKKKEEHKKATEADALLERFKVGSLAELAEKIAAYEKKAKK